MPVLLPDVLAFPIITVRSKRTQFLASFVAPQTSDPRNSASIISIQPRALAGEATSTIFGLSTLQFGTTLGGLAVITIAVLVWIFYRKKERIPAQVVFPPPFVGNWIPPPPVPVATPVPPMRAFSTMKREQDAAIPHYGDVHTEPDVLVNRVDGLQLLPGAPSARKTARPFWRYSSASRK
ncbi:hypothetical protein C8R43DRAFT_1052992 [Mycena crocata]|nr:hypothetical protein C8R43DRAFT_1052992 [Mycena crocata]